MLSTVTQTSESVYKRQKKLIKYNKVYNKINLHKSRIYGDNNFFKEFFCLTHKVYLNGYKKI